MIVMAWTHSPAVAMQPLSMEVLPQSGAFSHMTTPIQTATAVNSPVGMTPTWKTRSRATAMMMTILSLTATPMCNTLAGTERLDPSSKSRTSRLLPPIFMGSQGEVPISLSSRSTSSDPTRGATLMLLSRSKNEPYILVHSLLMPATPLPGSAAPATYSTPCSLSKHSPVLSRKLLIVAGL